MTVPTKNRRPFTAQYKQEFIDLCLQEGLTCKSFAERLGLLSFSHGPHGAPSPH